MSKLLITTQVYENYGAHDWDGTGECPQYWKAKGGEDYIVPDFVGSHEVIGSVLDRVRGQIEVDNDYFREYIVGTEIVEDNYLTQYERDQLEYEGQIMFPASELTLA